MRDPALQGHARDVLENGDELSTVFLQPVAAHEPRVLHALKGACLANEPLAHVRVLREGRRKDLERDEFDPVLGPCEERPPGRAAAQEGEDVVGADPFLTQNPAFEIDEPRSAQ